MAENKNYILPDGSRNPQAMILKGPMALGIDPMIDGFIH